MKVKDYKGFRAYECDGAIYFYDGDGHHIFKVGKNDIPAGKDFCGFAQEMIDAYLGEENTDGKKKL